MEVILSQDVPKLGKVGDVVRVKSGHARNFLIPKKIAFLATPSNLKRIELKKAKIRKEQDKIRSEAEALAEKMNKVSCTITVEVNELEKLYGAISDTDVVSALADEGYTVDRKAIIFEAPIEELGIFDVKIALHPEVTAKIRLWVTKK